MQPIDRARFFTSFRMTTLAFSSLRHSLLIKGFNLQKTRSNRDLNSHPIEKNCQLPRRQWACPGEVSDQLKDLRVPRHLLDHFV